jgi:hypothetical protein
LLRVVYVALHFGHRWVLLLLYGLIQPLLHLRGCVLGFHWCLLPLTMDSLVLGHWGGFNNRSSRISRVVWILWWYVAWWSRSGIGVGCIVLFGIVSYEEEYYKANESDPSNSTYHTAYYGTNWS